VRVGREERREREESEEREEREREPRESPERGEREERGRRETGESGDRGRWRRKRGERGEERGGGREREEREERERSEGEGCVYRPANNRRASSFRIVAVCVPSPTTRMNFGYRPIQLGTSARTATTRMDCLYGHAHVLQLPGRIRPERERGERQERDRREWGQGGAASDPPAYTVAHTRVAGRTPARQSQRSIWPRPLPTRQPTSRVDGPHS
jgi:hypothetical protein